MFLLFFVVFTLIFTLFKNITIASIFLLIIVGFLLFYQMISKKKILSRQVLTTLLLGCIIAFGAFVIKERSYYGNGFLQFSSSANKNETLLGTGNIADVSGQGKYIFVLQNEEYLLYSKKEYAIGDELRMVGRLQKNQSTNWFDYWTITSWTFSLPIFSGAFYFGTWMKMKWRKGTIYETNSIQLSRNDVIPAKAGIHDQQTGFPIKSGMTWWREGMTWPQSNPSIWIIKSLKKWIQEKIMESYGKNRVSWLLLGMLIGDRSQIPESEYQTFINSWLVHLVAVSWGNILMIVVFLQCVLFFLPFYARIGLILLTILGYSLICGLDSSVFRAVLMWGMNMIALFRWREVPIRRLLSMSAIIMLLINPYFLVYDTGFLLSYSALIGIIYFQNDDKLEMIDDKWNPPVLRTTPPLQKEDKKEKKIIKILQYIYKTYISPSIGASIGIFPIIIFFMGKINLMGIVGNLFVLPIVPFVMIYGFVSVWIYSRVGWSWVLWLETIAIQYIYTISDLLSTYGLYIMVTWLRLKYAFLLLCIGWFLFWRFKR